MKWDTVLAELSAKVDELERRLESEAWEDLEDTPFAPPDMDEDMTPEQRERAVALLQRVADCRKHLQEGMQQAQRGLGELDARRDGARSYASSDIAPA